MRGTFLTIDPYSILLDHDTNISIRSTLVMRVKELCQFPNEAESERILSGLRWIGLFSSGQATVRGNNLLDTLCAQLEKELSYQPKFVVEWHDGKKVQNCHLITALY